MFCWYYCSFIWFEIAASIFVSIVILWSCYSIIEESAIAALQFFQRHFLWFNFVWFFKYFYLRKESFVIQFHFLSSVLVRERLVLRFLQFTISNMKSQQEKFSLDKNWNFFFELIGYLNLLIGRLSKENAHWIAIETGKEDDTGLTSGHILINF